MAAGEVQDVPRGACGSRGQRLRSPRKRGRRVAGDYRGRLEWAFPPSGAHTASVRSVSYTSPISRPLGSGRAYHTADTRLLGRLSGTAPPPIRARVEGRAIGRGRYPVRDRVLEGVRDLRGGTGRENRCARERHRTGRAPEEGAAVHLQPSSTVLPLARPLPMGARARRRSSALVTGVSPVRMCGGLSASNVPSPVRRALSVHAALWTPPPPPGSGASVSPRPPW